MSAAATVPTPAADGGGEPARVVAVVPHTHWDREWYLPFQAFRLALVEMLDEFLPRLESDADYDRFLLDGQMAVVDDYLELRPDDRARLARLVENGRLTVGPWYILMDEFLVSGETIVRNLQMGLRRAEPFGGALQAGYLPDMFGHVAQMPQLLRLAGFDHAVVWRGVPAAVNRSAFWWHAPDGSSVRAEYLLDGYSNGAAVPHDVGAFLRRVQAFAAEREPFALAGDAPLLWMNGTDHQAPQPWLGTVLAAANARQDRFRFTLSSLAEYLDKAPTEGLPSWHGELRSGARANLLMGVASNRVDVKVAAARVEQALEKVAEPLCALWLAPEQWPAAELDLAWRQVIANSAHDSICACSHDWVATAVFHRFDDALAIAETLRRRAWRAAAAAVPAGGPVVVNPSASTRAGVVELVVPTGTPTGEAQIVEQVAAGTEEVTGTGADYGHLLSRLAAAGWRPDWAGPMAVTTDDDGIELSFSVSAQRQVDLRGASVLAEAEAVAAAHPERRLRIRAEREGWEKVAVRVDQVPGFGWASWQPGASPVASVGAETGAAGGGALPRLDNGILAVAVDPASGTWSIEPGDGRLALRGLGRLVDEGDAGDTYNYSPPLSDVVVDRPEAVTVQVLEAGPVRAGLRIVSRYRWPALLDGAARVGEVPVEVVTDLELRAGEHLVRVSTAFDNRARDHRLRAWFPLPSVADRSRAECAFAVVERGLTAEGGPHEYGLATFPSRRFVSAGGLTLLHEGLLEYQVEAAGTALALTLLRATGILSRPVMAYRDNSAGPAMALEGPQMQGPVRLRYAVHYGERDPYRLAEEAWVPLEVVYPAPMGAPGEGAPGEGAPGEAAMPGEAVPGGAQAGGLPGAARTSGSAAVPGRARVGGLSATRGSLLEVNGAEVSALQRVEGHLELRLFNPSHEETTVVVPGHAGWLVDLRGRRQQRFEGSFGLRPWGIATARLDG
jgi:hypothetical protein